VSINSEEVQHGLKAELAARGVKVSHNAVWLFLRREGLRFKKTLFALEQARTDVSRRRQRWRSWQAGLDPGRLLFMCPNLQNRLAVPEFGDVRNDLAWTSACTPEGVKADMLGGPRSALWYVPPCSPSPADVPTFPDPGYVLLVASLYIGRDYKVRLCLKTESKKAGG
jgi:hypothetical protein